MRAGLCVLCYTVFHKEGAVRAPFFIARVKSLRHHGFFFTKKTSYALAPSGCESCRKDFTRAVVGSCLWGRGVTIRSYFWAALGSFLWGAGGRV